jgi:Uma2 family endonuclease
MKDITEINQLDLTKTYTYSDYLTWKLHEKIELILGRIFRMSPAPSERHQNVSLRITKSLIPVIDKTSCRLYYAPFDVRFPDGRNSEDSEIITVVQPDIVIICDTSKIDEKGCLGAPDVIMEILSRGSKYTDLHEKYELYQKYGVKEYWIIDPMAETVQVNTIGNNGIYQPGRLITRGDRAESKIIGLSIDLNEIFPLSVEEPEEYYHPGFKRL